MKTFKLYVIISLIFLCYKTTSVNSQSKTITTTSVNQVSSLLTSSEKLTVKNLTINGVINDLDFVTLKNMTALERLDISNVTINAYSGYNGTSGLIVSYDYPANELPYKAFYNNILLKNIKLPKTIIAIDGCAFQGCTALDSVNIPWSVTKILGYAFSGCTGLKSLIIPPTITSTGIRAFENCGIVYTNIPNGISLGDYNFYGCSSLKWVYAESTTPVTINSTTFSGASSTLKIYVPSGTKSTYTSANIWKNYTIFDPSNYIKDSVRIHDSIRIITKTKDSIIYNYVIRYKDSVRIHDSIRIITKTKDSIIYKTITNYKDSIIYNYVTKTKDSIIYKTVTRYKDSIIYKTVLKSKDTLIVKYNIKDSIIYQTKTVIKDSMVYIVRDSIVLKYQTTTNISDLSKPKVSIYPNPVVDYFQINNISDNSNIKLYDIKGRVILEKSINQLESVFIDYLKTGTYYLVVNNQQKFQILKK